MRNQRGFTYLGVLLAIALLGIGVVAVSEVWVTTARRQRMEQLEWVGQQYARAIGSYYEASPGTLTKAYPSSLEDLLIDRRYSTVRRHLRSLYTNPFTGKADWTLVMTPQGGVCGVRTAVPWSTGELVREYVYRRPTILQ